MPAITKLTVAMRPSARALTVIVGVTAARVRVFAPESVHDAALEVSASPNTRLPMVRAVSRITSASADWSLAKEAVNPSPSATSGDHFPASLQLPFSSTFQKPSAA